MIDPRQLPARILGLATDPRQAEISVSTAVGRDAVHVRVPSFPGPVRRRAPSLLAVRIVNRFTDCPLANTPLTWDDSVGAWEATVPLCGLDADAVRVDVFDALSGLPPAGTDTDDGLQQARRVTALLGEWRWLAAVGQLSGGSPIEPDAFAARADGLREQLSGDPSADRIPPVGGVGRPLVAELAAAHVG
jgi:hypothetical protein